ncbi:MAG: thiol-disulfide oxidoreductase DCC family protein [Rhodomicrobium sp.]
MRPIDRQDHSYRFDSAVPAFDDHGPVVFMDGGCVLCTGAARTIAKLDRMGEFRICPVKSELGQAVLRHYGLDPHDPHSWIYLEDGKPYVSLEAVVRAAARLGGWAGPLRALRFLPRPVQDWLYRRIARNRYWIFGRTEMCTIPDPALKRRLLA